MKIGLRELTFFLLLAAIPIGAAMFVFVPRWHNVAEMEVETLEKQVRLERLDQVSRTTESLGQELKDLSDALTFFESKLPNSQQIHTVLREVTQISESHQLTTKSVRTLKQQEAAEFVALPIEMELTGDFSGVYQFLYDLHKLPRITRITQMNLAKDKKQEGVVEAKLIVLIYFEPGGQPAAPATDRVSSAGRYSGWGGAQ